METKNAKKHLEGCRSKTNWLPLRKEIPWIIQAYSFLRWRGGQRVYFPDECKTSVSTRSRRPLSKEMVDWTIFQMAKQHLKIKKFWGTTENAVRIQISVAIITYCLVAIIQHDMDLKRSTYEVLQILSISLTDKTYLRDLFDKTNFNDVKEQFVPLIPGLFN